MRYKDSTISQTINATTLQTKTHDKALPMEPLARIDVLNTGANNSLAGSGVDTYKVKHQTGEKWVITPTRLRALLEALVAPLGGSTPAAADLGWTLPLDLFLPLPIGLPKDPVPQLKSFEIYLNAANSSAGTSLVGSYIPDQAPTYMSILKEGQTGVGANVTQGGTYFVTSPHPETDLFVGFILPLGDAAAHISRMTIFRKLASGYDEMWDGARSFIYQSQKHYNPEAITDPFFFKLPGAPITMPQGSKIIFYTGADALESDVIVPVYLEKW